MIDELTLGVVPFRGSWAVQRGLVSRGVLCGPRFRRLFRDVYLLEGVPADLATRSSAAFLVASGQRVLSGYSAAELQYQVYDRFGEFIARLDMAYPLLKLGMEYDGRGHLTEWQQQSDARRLNRLAAAGWTVLRFTSSDVLRTPDAIATQVRDGIARRSRRSVS